MLPRSRRGGLLRAITRQFNNPLVYVLLAAAGVTAYLGEQLDTAVILAVVVLNTVIGLVQEARAEAALDALRHMVPKFIVWTLPTNMGEGLVILVAILIGGTLPSCRRRSSGSI
ncbi:hypothetical protein NFC73_06395 [Pseudarthrobacter sp. RMG13]|uniref:Cation-transporting P-type ATPase N-terminal domain-containing protein n=1 Tax=Pseudarthrobacter humi TaxID=2952523 RepID=A0ABT1LNC3_9MICC|nr:hypothetical protein [Pseudarthrobacter humi]